MNITFTGTYKFYVQVYIEDSFQADNLVLTVKDRIRQVDLSEELICVDRLEKNKWIYIESDSFQIFKKNYQIKLEIKNLEKQLINSGFKISHSFLLPSNFEFN